MMAEAAQEFERLIAGVLTRFFMQNAQPPPPADDLRAFSAGLWTLIAERGLPPALGPGERGSPREMPELECAALVARVPGAASHPLLGHAARQLVKTCFHPEFRTCRDSFRAVSPDGTCRRQELSRARSRVSGTHCVDCPHWLGLTPQEHACYLASQWCSDPANFHASCNVFLPEDFRALRRWIREHAPAPK